MRCRFAAAGVPSPAVPAVAHLRRSRARRRAPRVSRAWSSRRCLSGSRGVMRADDPAELVGPLRAPARASCANERCDEVLVEDYIPGVEVALEGLLDGGALRVARAVRQARPARGPVLRGDDLRHALAPAGRRAGARSQAHGARPRAALGLREGPIHAELRVNERRARACIEVAARSIGGLCSRTLRFGTGMSLEELILRHALGWPIASARARAPRRRRDDDPDPARRPAARRARASRRRRRCRASRTVEITAHMDQPLVPLPEGRQLPRASSSPAATRRTWSRPRCAPRMPACASRSSPSCEWRRPSSENNSETEPLGSRPNVYEVRFPCRNGPLPSRLQPGHDRGALRSRSRVRPVAPPDGKQVRPHRGGGRDFGLGAGEARRLG